MSIDSIAPHKYHEMRDIYEEGSLRHHAWYNHLISAEAQNRLTKIQLWKIYSPTSTIFLLNGSKVTKVPMTPISVYHMKSTH